jgi:hypothetical protein
MMRETNECFCWSRMRRLRFPLVMLLSALVVIGTFGATARSQTEPQSQADLNTPLTAPGGPPGLLSVEPTWKPAPLVVQGKAYLVYELLLTNFQTAPVTLESLRADAGPMGIFKFGGDDLKRMIDLPDRYGTKSEPLTFQPLATRMLLLWLPFSSPRVPHRVIHTLTYSVSSGSGAGAQTRLMSAEIRPLKIDHKEAPIVIGPPLRGNNWLAGNGPSNTSNHRRAFFVANGQIYFPERFAIDFVQIGPDGKTYSGNPKDNHSYHAYGADIIAVADGRIVDAKGGIKDNVPGAVAGPVTMATIGGNYLIEDIGHGAYAFYAHLRRGSIKAWVGAQVKHGQVLASLGNTGNSSEPHLHFHVIDAPSPLAGNGIPYAFDRFSVLPGHVNESAQEIIYEFAPGQPTPVTDSLVLENALMDFPSTGQH